MENKMKKACVGYISFFENDMKQMIVDVDSDNWKDALIAAIINGIAGDAGDIGDMIEWIKTLSGDMDEARSEFTNADMDFSVIFV